MKIHSLKPAPARAAAPRRGFSLAELMVVIVILGLLATLVVPNVLGYLFKANTAVVKNNISTLCTAIDTYALENGGRFPDSLEQLLEPDENGKTYLRNTTTVPRDPWKNEYLYEPPDGQQDYRVFSYGKDGQAGGEGEDADIDNFTMADK